jgi:hypothetical protein
VIVALDRLGHLARRFAGSLSDRPPDTADVGWVSNRLDAGELELWQRMSNPDRRHSIEVARRFVARRPAASRAEVAGALLHDCGKVEAGLGTIGRVLATVAGPRTDRFRTYHDHEVIGARLAAAAGSAAETVDLIEGRGPAAPDLIAADEI